MSFFREFGGWRAPTASSGIVRPESLVRLQGLSKAFGGVVAVHPLDLEISQGDFLAILGPSGCGKTTLLRMLGGLEAPDTGTIEIEGRDVTSIGPEKRTTNMVFQGYGLFPHMTVRQNVAYGLRLKKLPKAEVSERVNKILSLVRMQSFADRLPQNLSGGQQQRVALARALVMRPAVLLLDEPLAALDLRLRKDMQGELRRIHRTTGGTFVVVTHDQEEAMSMANHIVVMEAGRIVQQGAPDDIYRNPVSRFAATFIGEANLIEGHRKAGQVTLPGGGAVSAPGPDGPTVLVLRPEAMTLEPGTSGRLTGTVSDAIFLGPVARILVTLPDGGEVAAHLPAGNAKTLPAPGNTVALDWHEADMRWIDG